MNHIKTFLERCQETQPRIAVIGDAMIDEYFHVDASRVSPEFPIPVMRSWPDQPDVVVPGGAGNVCLQFRNFFFGVTYYGLLDQYAKEVMSKAGIHTQAAALEGGEMVPRKRRFYHGQFPLCRWDVEDKNFGIIDNTTLQIRQRIMQMAFEREVKEHGPPAVMILSDYDKGVFSGCLPVDWWLDPERVGSSITIVDPKKGPVEKWRGCNVFKPNVKEAQDLSGYSDWRDQCKFFQAKLGCQAVVITQGGEGVVGQVGLSPFEYRPTRTIYPDSVIGAGDCFVAFLAMGLAHSMDIRDVVAVAYEAGAIYVQRKHNTPVAPHELLGRVDPEGVKLRIPPQERDYKLVFTNGCFDILHEGHLATLRRSRELGDKLVVAVNSDESVRALKGEYRPIINAKERMRMLAGLECVDFVVEFNEETPYNIIQQIKPDVLVKGADWAGNIVGSDIVPEVHALPLIGGLSTSGIISKIKEEDEIKPDEIKTMPVGVDIAGIMKLPGIAEQTKDTDFKENLSKIPSRIKIKDEGGGVIGMPDEIK